MFSLHPRLAADTALITELPLCSAMLMKDARYPWVILVPRQEDLKEVHQLDNEDGQQLWLEIRTVSEIMENNFTCDKINIGALGNMVPQLHVHIIAREIGDTAWPGPVWGVGEAEEYLDAELDSLLITLRDELENVF